jgi:hypothetical protein
MAAMRKLALALLVLAVFAAPASAAPPTKQVITQTPTLTDATACGTYGVTWRINLTATIWTFRDDLGRRTKTITYVEEDNTVENTVTGLTLRDGPVDFVDTTTFDPETGLREQIVIVGTSVNVRRGRERLLDTGLVVIDGQTLKITFSLGPHPLRQRLSDAGSLNPALALPGFCHILRP